MPFESNSGLSVNTSYGRRSTGGVIGVETGDQSEVRLSINFTGESINSAFLPPVVFPQGAKVTRYILRVDEAFSLGGTSPTVIFGGTAPATNGVVLTKTELEAVGTKIPASAGTGTWSTTSATGATAAEKVTKALGGTSPTVASTQGKATLIAVYDNKRRS